MPSAVDGVKICSKCERELPATPEYYHRNSQQSDGFEPRCKVCRGNPGYGLHRPSYQKEVDGDHKYCKGCDRILPKDLDHFFRNRSMSDGFDYPCKECQGNRFGKNYPNRYVEEGFKVCWRCEEKKPEEDGVLVKNKDSPTGFTSLCVECSREIQLERKLDSQEIEEVLNFFFEDDGMACVYCDSETDDIHYDHIVPLSKGGETKFGNLVPACEDCNLRKHTKDLDEWYPEQEFHDKRRMDKIMEYQSMKAIIEVT